jgi:hypothetical protein
VSGFEVVILPTDALVYLLVAVIVFTIWYVRRKEHLLAPWQRVAHSPSGMVGLTVLLMFVMIGLLDSLHYRERLPTTESSQPVYAVEVSSMLDCILKPLRIHGEKTYSAPLATHGYAKETVTLPGGGEQRVFPRLVYGGAQLADVERDSFGSPLSGYLPPATLDIAGSLHGRCGARSGTTKQRYHGAWCGSHCFRCLCLAPLPVHWLVVTICLAPTKSDKMCFTRRSRAYARRS